MEFKEKIKLVRLRLMMSQKEIAKELGVSFATVNRWEKGHHEPTFLVRRKFDDLCKKHNIFFDE